MRWIKCFRRFANRWGIISDSKHDCMVPSKFVACFEHVCVCVCECTRTHNKALLLGCTNIAITSPVWQRHNRIIRCLYTRIKKERSSPIHIVCYFVFGTMRLFHVPPFIIKPSLCLWNASSAEYNIPNKMN